jgi:hypothetical protein
MIHDMYLSVLTSYDYDLCAIPLYSLQYQLQWAFLRISKLLVLSRFHYLVKIQLWKLNTKNNSHGLLVTEVLFVGLYAELRLRVGLSGLSPLRSPS